MGIPLYDPIYILLFKHFHFLCHFYILLVEHGWSVAPTVIKAIYANNYCV